MVPDFLVNNGQGYEAHGDVASLLLANDFDPNALRPYIGDDQRPYITKNQGGKATPVLAYNAPATLRIREWIELDAAVMDAVYTTPMRMWADLRARGDAIGIPNGMGKSTYEYQRVTDVGPAITSFDGIREGDSDRLHFDYTGIPLPIVHKDFQFSARQLSISRNGGPSLDTMMARLSARKVMEEVEKYTVGSQTFAFGGYNIYGYTNFPARLTQTITAPSSNNHATTISELLSMRKKLTDKGYGGPFRVYMSNAWDQYLDEDYSTAGSRMDTLRQRILRIDGIQSVDRSYWLGTGNAIVMVQMTPDVAQAVVGMDVTTLQWPSKGGMAINFKIMAILVPLLRSDINGLTGICHGS